MKGSLFGPVAVTLRVPLVASLILAATAAQGWCEEAPRLQILNASAQAIDIFWLKSATEQVANGSVEPGKDLIINTTLGHQFRIVGRTDQAEATVTSEVPSCQA